ncbi:hypothetical protein [Streptoalloteichus hindustanus]|uniref:Uncharacterized protein n=1 Tax=Streptoalloteichus hindustanus TaxID=2017 RepID=A0A1M4YBB1_STRHI|nr:hypothetical protein [Streptoalloteichus hindustanus]SHF03015.1 hypothetical protein SAMN05444320_102302 [Streptoalloteichus hindustanus]
MGRHDNNRDGAGELQTDKLASWAADDDGNAHEAQDTGDNTGDE